MPALFARGAAPVAALLLLTLTSSLPAAAQTDPVAMPLWRTYLGGGGVDRIRGVAQASNGDIVVVGTTTSQDLAANGSANELSLPDAFVARYTAAGVRQYAFAFGGTEEDEANAVALSPSGDVYIVGRTNSATVTRAGAVHGGSLQHDAFLAKVKANGTPEWFMYLAGNLDLSGNRGVDVATAVAVADTGTTVYIAGHSTSANLAGSGGAIHGKEDGFVMKIGVASASTTVPPTVDGMKILGGSESDLLTGITLLPGGVVLVVGTTSSDTLVSAPQAVNSKKTGSDALVAKLDMSSSPQQDNWLSFVGSEGADEGVAIAALGDGQIVVGGTTGSSQFDNPEFPPRDLRNAFVAWLASDGQVSRAQLFGGNGYDESTGMVIDGASNVYLAGRTTSQGVARTNPFDGVLELVQQAQDGFVTMFPASPGRGWASYAGGNNPDEVGALSILYTSSEIRLVIAGQTQSADGLFPPTPTQDDSSLSTKGDGFIVALKLKDTTPPIQGTVQTAGIQSGNSTSISASWGGFSDNESSIVDYEWAIFRRDTPPELLMPFEQVMATQASTLLQPAQPIGTAYYVTVRAHTSTGLATEASSLDAVVMEPVVTDGGTGQPDGGSGQPDGGSGEPDGGSGEPDGGAGGGKGGDKGSPLGWGCAAAGGAGVPLLLGLIAFVLLGRRQGQPSR